MKSFALFNAALVLPGLASAAICNNNCGRAVAGTNRRDPPYATRLSLCQDFVTTYDIPPVPLPSPIGVRNVHAPRQVSEPIITGTKPAYATSCPDVTAYWSACQCFSGVVPTTITSIPEPTFSTSVTTSESESSSASESTTTEEPETTLETTVTVTPETSSASETSSAPGSSIEPESSSASESSTASESESVSETSVTTETSSASETSSAPETTSTSESASESESSTSSESAISTELPTETTSIATSSSASTSTPSCTPGVQYARYFYTQGSPLCDYLSNNTTPPREYDLQSLLEGRVPNITGVTTRVGFDVVNSANPVTIYGVDGPAGTTAQCQIVGHRGYLKPSTIGIYTIAATEPDDIILFWIGSNANSGSFRASNSDVYAQHNQPTRSQYGYTVIITDASEYIPFRLIWTNGRLSGKFTVEIKNFTGDMILGRTTTANPSIIASCDEDGSPVPAWADWEEEVIPLNGN